MDTLAVGEVFAFTGVDIDTKEVDVVLRPGLTSEDGGRVPTHGYDPLLHRASQIVQTDGGPEFKGAFAQLAPQYCGRHRIARP